MPGLPWSHRQYGMGKVTGRQWVTHIFKKKQKTVSALHICSEEKYNFNSIIKGCQAPN